MRIYKTGLQKFICTENGSCVMTKFSQVYCSYPDRALQNWHVLKMVHVQCSQVHCSHLTKFSNKIYCNYRNSGKLFWKSPIDTGTQFIPIFVETEYQYSKKLTNLANQGKEKLNCSCHPCAVQLTSLMWLGPLTKWSTSIFQSNIQLATCILFQCAWRQF